MWFSSFPVVVVLLAACAFYLQAAPPNNITEVVTETTNNNEITTNVAEDSSVNEKPTTEKCQENVTGDDGNNEEPTLKKNKNKNEENIEANETDNTGSVIERFPHAVLFGGTCGGTIISPTWVITAAHCTLFTSGHRILAGTDNSDNDSGVSVPVKRLIPHPRFSVGPYWLDVNQYNIKQIAARFDFMLVELARPLPIDGKRIAVVLLDDNPVVPAGTDVAYAGYGASIHGDTMSDHMHSMELSSMDDKVCAERLFEFDKQDMMCAKGRPPRFDSACNGDSGSGLVGNGKLLGVASWVEDDARVCRPGALVVFSRVSLVREWIRKITGV